MTETNEPKEDLLLLIDTFYFLHRSFHAFSKDLQTSTGEPTGMVFGFAISLMNSLSDMNPTHIACGWESEELPSFRKELYPEYQANRIPGEPEEEKMFWDQIPRIVELLDAFNIPRLSQNGFEGDDVLGTIASLSSPKVNVVISTADQDLLQLINDKVSVFRPASPPYVKKKLYNRDEFFEKYEFEPHQMIDYKSLRGDPSDNIPGVKGVGDKTAKQLLKQFKSLEDIYENLDQIEREVIRNKLQDNKDEAFISKQLATIITNIPMDFDIEDCKVHDFDSDKVRAFFDKLEFSSLNKKLDKLEVIKGIKERTDEKEKKNQPNKDQMSLF